MPARTAFLTIVAFVAIARLALAQTGAHVLVVMNEESADSVKVGQHYANVRAVPATNIVRLKAPVRETISRGEFQSAIEAPIANWLGRHRLQDQILYIVLTKGVPIRIDGTGGQNGTMASVDSELTLLYRKLVGQAVATAGRVDNPYFLGDRDPTREARPFTRRGWDIYLVTRLDGFTAADAIALVDRAQAPTSQGVVVLDQRTPIPDRGGDDWLKAAADRLRQTNQGDRVTIEMTSQPATTPWPVLGFSSWGSNDPAHRARQAGLRFAPGAIATTYVSLDGRTFVEPPDTWKPTDTTRPDLWFAGAPQTLAGDLVREGITGTSAHVAEPFFSAMIRPQVLFPAYLRGLNLAEAFYLSMPYLSWQTMILGDPLCAVMPREAVPAAELESKVDGETDLPVHLSTRRLALMLAGDPRLNTAAIKLGMRAENAFSQGDIVAGEAFLTRAADLEPRLTGVQVRLASLLESAGKVADAMARYRKVLDLEPNNALALNNLAYALAVHSGSPRDALPLAERAYRLVPDLPDIADTLGWIHHLLGDDRIAAGLVDRAVRGAPDNLDMRLHAAVVFASVGDKARAKLELDAALKLDPASASRPEASLARQLIGGTLF